MRASYFIGLGLFFCRSAAALEPAPAVRVVSPLVQVFPSSVPAGQPTARVEAARGEHEPFQIVVHAGGRGLDGVRAESGPLVSDAGAMLPPPSLARVEYLEVKTPSSVEGHAGPWPDALVPDVDELVHERRRAFPFAVPPHQSRAIWVELFVPRGAAPGRYRGQVRLTSDGHDESRVPIELVVHRFTLPATSSLPVTFGFSAAAIARAHPGLAPSELAELVRRYQLMALRDRISLHGGTMEPPPVTKTGALDFTAYDAEVGPFLDGTADPGGPAEGARWTAIDLRAPYRLAGAARVDYLRRLARHLEQRGWLDRAFDYTFDEPSDAQLDDVRRRAALVRYAVPSVPRLVTRALDPRLVGSVDIWCPVVNLVDDKPGNSDVPRRDGYDARLARGERLWWYQACMSHGCNIVGGDYFTGWPSYAIDAPALSHRIFEWLTFRYRIGGELYYDTVEAYARGLDPWRDQLLFGGNGDGTLFYPGRAAIIGGTHDIPVASIRLQLIREGLEDYEYLRLYARAAGQDAADALVRAIAPRTFHWEHDAQRLLQARHRMAEAIDAKVASDGELSLTAR